MNEIKYKQSWREIDRRFNKWYGGEEWETQMKFLSVEMRSSFKLSKKQIENIFNTFLEIYKDGSKIRLDWETYQLPTLVSITANYVK